MPQSNRRKAIELSLLIDDLIDEGVISEADLGEEVPSYVSKRHEKELDRQHKYSRTYNIRTIEPKHLHKVLSTLAGREGKTVPSLIIYSVDGTGVRVLIDRNVVTLRRGSLQFDICQLLFNEDSHATWSWDEIADEIGEDPTSKAVKNKVYKAYYDLSKKINVYAPDLILTTSNDVTLNQTYEVRRFT